MKTEGSIIHAVVTKISKWMQISSQTKVVDF